MGETIAVLIIFFFLLIFGAVFFFNVQRSKIVQNQGEFYAQESIKVSQITAYLPELQCSTENIVNDNCFDKYKLDAARGHIMNNSNFYFPFFTYSEIMVEEIYPNKLSWTLYNFTINQSGKIQSGIIPTYIPLSLYDPITKQYSFGVLYIGYFPFYSS